MNFLQYGFDKSEDNLRKDQTDNILEHGITWWQEQAFAITDSPQNTSLHVNTETGKRNEI